MLQLIINRTSHALLLGPGMKCTEPNLLLLKATSQATLLCLDQCLGVLRTQHMSAPHHQPSPPVTSVRYDPTAHRCSYSFHVGQSLFDVLDKVPYVILLHSYYKGKVRVVCGVFHCICLHSDAKTTFEAC